ncbi:MAG: GGDEF domain-containing protein [Magnetococcales bacterium]|nr:GGDEF domain-containing protein [Magnetococcales bacterium]
MTFIVLLSSLSVLLLTVTALFSNERIANYQRELLADALPVSEANRHIVHIIDRVKERQNEAMVMTARAELDVLQARPPLEQEYYTARAQFDYLTSRFPAMIQILAQMDNTFAQYVATDRQLLTQHQIRITRIEQITRQTALLEQLIAGISDRIEALVGHVYLAGKKQRRLLRQMMERSAEASEMLPLMRDELLGTRADIRDVTASIQDGVMTLRLLTQQLLLEHQEDLLASIKGNYMDQSLNLVQQSLEKLGKLVVGGDPALQSIVADLQQHLVQLPQLLTHGEQSLLGLRHQQLAQVAVIEKGRFEMELLIAVLVGQLAQLDSPAGMLRNEITHSIATVVSTSRALLLAVTFLVLMGTLTTASFLIRLIIQRSNHIVDALGVCVKGNYNHLIPVHETSHADSSCLDQIAAMVNTLVQSLKESEEMNLRAMTSRIAISALLEVSLAPLSLKEYLKVALQIILAVPWMKLQNSGAVFLTDDHNQLALAACHGIDEEDTDKLLDSSDAEGHYRFPIVAGSRSLGVVTLDLVGGYPPTSEREVFLSTVANTLAGVIERKKVEEQLQHLAHHDTLTGLPNRVQFNEYLAMALTRAVRSRSVLAVMLLDLDRFKQVNDTLGHAAGDQLLVAVTHRIKGCLRSSDLLARLGGDEFVVVLQEIAHADDATLVGTKMIDVLGRPFEITGQNCDIGVSIGISLYPNHGTTAEELLSQADQAMYAVKEGGRNGILCYGSVAAP